MKKNISIALVFLSIFLCFQNNLKAEKIVKKNIPAPLKELITGIVEKAIAFYDENGKKITMDEISNRNGRFVFGSVYVAAYDMNLVILAHPINKKIIGRKMLNWIDPEGKYFRKEIKFIAQTKGSGWVSYEYIDPKTNTNRKKITYIKKHKKIIFACGFYVD